MTIWYPRSTVKVVLATYSLGLKLLILMLLIRVDNIVLSVNTFFAVIIFLGCYFIGVCIYRGLAFAHMQ